jgi:uncharacterized protein
LKDNYMRFYLKYIFPNKHKIESSMFEKKSLMSLPGWSTIMGLQFENLVLNNRQKIWELLQLQTDEIVCDGSFFQHVTTKQKGCQIDYMIQTKSKNLYICEVKFYAEELKKDITTEMQEKIKRIKKPKGFSCRPVLIHVNGVQKSVVEADYFSNIISFGDLL